MCWINIEDEEPVQNQYIWVPTGQGDVLAKYAGNRRIWMPEGFVGHEYGDYVVAQWKKVE